MDILPDWLVGPRAFQPAKPGPRAAPLPWPTKQEVGEARDYRKKYGNPNEQDIDRKTPVGLLSYGQYAALDDADKLDKPKRTVELGDDADRQDAAQIAALQNPLAYLGKDINRVTVVPELGNPNGRYEPRTDQMFHAYPRTPSPTTPVHEATHRGLKLLRDAGLLSGPITGQPKYALDPGSAGSYEEAVVRAQMIDRHGPGIEPHAPPSQIRQANDVLQNEIGRARLDAINEAAHQLIAKRLIEKQGAVY